MLTDTLDPEIAELDYQPLAEADAAEIAQLLDWARAQLTKSDDDASPELKEFCSELVKQLDQGSYRTVVPDEARAHTTYQLMATSGDRTYNVEVRVDDGFGDRKEWVRDRTQTMLDRMIIDQTNRFIVRARAVGMNLNWRRNRTYGFPHDLPYASPSPSTQSGKIAEEAAVTCAAANFAFSRPGIQLTINSYKKPAKVKNGKKYWSGGFATVNLYNRVGSLTINLNLTAINEAKFSPNYWASTIAHEILHNLGWGHPDGSYPSDLPIEIWQWCIETADRTVSVHEPVDEVLIR